MVMVQSVPVSEMAISPQEPWFEQSDLPLPWPQTFPAQPFCSVTLKRCAPLASPWPLRVNLPVQMSFSLL